VRAMVVEVVDRVVLLRLVHSRNNLHGRVICALHAAVCCNIRIQEGRSDALSLSSVPFGNRGLSDCYVKESSDNPRKDGVSSHQLQTVKNCLAGGYFPPVIESMWNKEHVSFLIPISVFVLFQIMSIEAH